MDVLRAYTDSIARLDVDACAAMLAADAVLVAPFAPDPIPVRTEGAATIEAMLRQVYGMFRSFTWTEREIHATDDPELALMTGRSAIELANGEDYGQEYVLLVRVRDGRIIEHREYFDPARAQRALATMASA